MNLTQLRAFHLVARERSFTRGAAAARLSQPTLSSQVRALEASYRLQLFERRGRHTELTTIGQGLYDITSRLFALEDEARALLAGTKALTRGHLRVLAGPPLAEVNRRVAGLQAAAELDRVDMEARAVDGDLEDRHAPGLH